MKAPQLMVGIGLYSRSKYFLNWVLFLLYFLGCGICPWGTASAAVENKATLLKRNKIANNIHFDNFSDVKIRVDVPAFPMQGKFRFIRIYDDKRNMLFLGQVSPEKSFSIPLNKLTTEAYLTIELFSEDPLDKVQKLKSSELLIK